ncbi:hypothetical protein [Bacillus sp. UMB0893]|nr:hypothetical protein [Bacillus sp. UMB0893]
MTKEIAIILLTEQDVYLTEQGRQVLEAILMEEDVNVPAYNTL